MPSTTLNLAVIAATLESFEETIIFKLIDRAQYHVNCTIYEPGKSGFEGDTTKSLFELRLWYQERMDAEFGRFLVPEERPFCADLPFSKRSIPLAETGLGIADYTSINLSDDIKRSYQALLPCICRSGSDDHYGSSVEHDIYALQAIARRVHYGALYVAESKYQNDPQKYIALAKNGDHSGILAALTRTDVEEAILCRVRDKVAHAQNQVNQLIRHTINPEAIFTFYRETIIPLTKKGELTYLLLRCGK